MNTLTKSFLINAFLPCFSRPIFILSAPRSGSSYLYEIIRRMSDVWSFDKENDPLWFRFFPYERLILPTDYISNKECTPEKIKEFQADLVLANLKNRRYSRFNDGIKYFLLRQPIRYLEKTIANCFHLEALDKIFHDALFIHLVRDGRACISSMIEGWDSGFFWKRDLPFSEGSTISHWCYPIPPGWQNVVNKPLEEICAWSWVEHNRYVLDWCSTGDRFDSQWLRISYENFLADPLMVIERIATFTGLEISDNCTNYLKEKRLSWTTISHPKSDKWKEKNFDVINRVIPLIKPMMQKLDYQI